MSATTIHSTARQDPYPHDGTRTCTYPGHEGENPLPATAEYFPVRKSGPKAGQFVGWCAHCQKLAARRHKAEPERQNVRVRRPVELIEIGERGAVAYVPPKPKPEPKVRATKATKVAAAQAAAFALADIAAANAYRPEQPKPKAARRAR